MTVANGSRLLELAPIVNMLETKERANGVSHGLVEVGYDIRIKQDIVFTHRQVSTIEGLGFQMCSLLDGEELQVGRFRIASSVEQFGMPFNLMGVVHDKSTWARRGLSVFNTVIEPGWCGFLTLELVYHGQDELHIPAGSGIAQVIFHELALPAEYTGKYQHQEDRPVEAILALQD